MSNFIQLTQVTSERHGSEREHLLLLRPNAIQGARRRSMGYRSVEINEILVADEWIQVKEPVYDVQQAIRLVVEAMKATRDVFAVRCSACGGGTHYDVAANVFSLAHTEDCSWHDQGGKS